MSGSLRDTLRPGDLLWWEPGPEEENVKGAPLLVTEDGERFQFQFARQAWDEMSFDGSSGLTVREAERVLRGEESFRLPGHIYKCYDEESGRSFNDPALEADE